MRLQLLLATLKFANLLAKWLEQKYSAQKDSDRACRCCRGQDAIAKAVTSFEIQKKLDES